LKRAQRKINVSRNFTIIEERFFVDAVDISVGSTTFYVLNVNIFSTAYFFCDTYINTLSRVPSKIASFLKLPDAEFDTV
jgi:hypothetical protein